MAYNDRTAVQGNEGGKEGASTACQGNVRWLPVLMYHRIVETVRQPDPYHLYVSRADFEAQMAYLARRRYQAIHLSEAPLALGGRSPWRKPVAITFDDGYLDTYTEAYPILKKYGLTATVMLVSEYIGGTNTWDYGKAERTQLLSMDEILEMHRGGIQFGSHGATHTPLTMLGATEVEQELTGSKATLEGLLGCPVLTLAYPFGRSTPDIHQIARQAGYTVACGIEQRSHTLFDLSRVDAAASRGDSIAWRLKLLGVHHRLRQVRGLRRLRYLARRVLQ